MDHPHSCAKDVFKKALKYGCVLITTQHMNKWDPDWEEGLDREGKNYLMLDKTADLEDLGKKLTCSQQKG